MVMIMKWKKKYEECWGEEEEEEDKLTQKGDRRRKKQVGERDESEDEIEVREEGRELIAQP